MARADTQAPEVQAADVGRTRAWWQEMLRLSGVAAVVSVREAIADDKPADSLYHSHTLAAPVHRCRAPPFAENPLY